MEFWRGTAVFRFKGHIERVEARVFVDLDLDLKIELLNNLGFEALFLGAHEDITIEIPEVSAPIPLLPSHFSYKNSGEEQLVMNVKRTPVWKGSTGVLKRGTSALLNFTGYTVGPLTRSRTVLLATGWTLTFTPVHKDLLSYPKLIAGEKHQITHNLEFERTDGSFFSREEMWSFLARLNQFFSFCHGGWVGTALTVGQNENGLASLEEWGHGRLGPSAKPDCWLDPHHLEGMVELYPRYMERTQDEDWADAIGQVVYWLRRSEIEKTGPDGGIILIQAALERFAWHLLVRDKGALSEHGFERLTAADRMRLLVSHLRLPRAIPVGLGQLAKFAAADGLDAPEAFTRIRNKIVHPSRRGDKPQELPYYDAYRLGRWYAELMVLVSAITYLTHKAKRPNIGSWKRLTPFSKQSFTSRTLTVLSSTRSTCGSRTV